MASDNCAVGPNGKLLDQSEIPWYNDPENDMPMAPATTSHSTVQGQPSATTLNSFITKAAPTVHRSTHAPRLSTKSINLDNIMSLKCKLSNTTIANPSCCPCQASPKHKEDKATEPDLTDTEDSNLLDPEVAHEEANMLSDADHVVCVVFPSQALHWHFVNPMHMKTKEVHKVSGTHYFMGSETRRQRRVEGDWSKGAAQRH